MNTGNGPAFYFEQAFKLNTDRRSMRPCPTVEPQAAIAGQARSHRIFTALKHSAFPVGAGLSRDCVGTANP
ncbi:hypothetical protein ELF58_26515 [Salmonella enterica]|nr:hypothetical protein [Salmonella enterica]